ncbi:hypothetical protein ABEY05_06305 [Bacillus subtilis]|uniref:hypothetical protein n=1 Tax=Bacillus sp. SG20033 TaxID=3366583 RepID=UPI0037C52328
MNYRTIVEKNIRANNGTINQRDLVMQEQKRNLKYLEEVLLGIGFIAESVEVYHRELYALS